MSELNPIRKRRKVRLPMHSSVPDSTGGLVENFTRHLFIWVKLESNEIFKSTSGKCSTYTKFSVSEIEYDENREVSKCIIVDNNGVIRYQFPMPKEKKSEKTQQNQVYFPVNS